MTCLKNLIVLFPVLPLGLCVLNFFSVFCLLWMCLISASLMIHSITAYLCNEFRFSSCKFSAQITWDGKEVKHIRSWTRVNLFLNFVSFSLSISNGVSHLDILLSALNFNEKSILYNSIVDLFQVEYNYPFQCRRVNIGNLSRSMIELNAFISNEINR